MSPVNVHPVRQVCTELERPSVVPRGGVEPPTLRFSVACSTQLSYLGNAEDGHVAEPARTIKPAIMCPSPVSSSSGRAGTRYWPVNQRPQIDIGASGGAEWPQFRVLALRRRSGRLQARRVSSITQRQDRNAGSDRSRRGRPSWCARAGSAIGSASNARTTSGAARSQGGVAMSAPASTCLRAARPAACGPC